MKGTIPVRNYYTKFGFRLLDRCGLWSDSYFLVKFKIARAKGEMAV